MCVCVRGGTQLVEELVVHCALAPCATCPPRYQLLLLLLHSRHGRRDATLTPARKGIPETSQVVQELSSLSNFSYFAQDLCFNKWLKVRGCLGTTELHFTLCLNKGILLPIDNWTLITFYVEVVLSRIIGISIRTLLSKNRA